VSATLRRPVWAALSLALLAASPAQAVRVFLDADVDGDPATFRNEVDGPLETMVDVVVALDEGDAGLAVLPFLLEWDCTPGSATCLLGMPHGDIGWSALDDAYPFSSIGMSACTGFGCGCSAARYFEATVDATPTGFFVLGTLPFTRLGVGADCDDLVYPDVEFRVVCGECDYAPGDEAFTTMRLTGTSDATVTPEGSTSSSWGSTKATYR
jgi:hypothetical protein